MNLLQLFRCLAGEHKANERRVRLTYNGWRARCRGCGRKMVRFNDGWMLHR